MDVLKYPDPRLKQTAEPIEEITDEIRDRAKEMLTKMVSENGIGLAAPQIGWGVRLFVVNTTHKPEDALVLVNPEITQESKETWLLDEGCLSLPGIKGKVKRPKEVIVRAQSLDGEEFEVKADGLVGRCIQHEFDHLNGVLFIDRLSSARKVLLRKKLKALREPL